MKVHRSKSCPVPLQIWNALVTQHQYLCLCSLLAVSQRHIAAPTAMRTWRGWKNHYSNSVLPFPPGPPTEDSSFTAPWSWVGSSPYLPKDVLTSELEIRIKIYSIIRSRPGHGENMDSGKPMVGKKGQFAQESCLRGPPNLVVLQTVISHYNITHWNLAQWAWDTRWALSWGEYGVGSLSNPLPSVVIFLEGWGASVLDFAPGPQNPLCGPVWTLYL